TGHPAFAPTDSPRPMLPARSRLRVSPNPPPLAPLQRQLTDVPHTGPPAPATVAAGRPQLNRLPALLIGAESGPPLQPAFGFRTDPHHIHQPLHGRQIVN